MRAKPERGHSPVPFYLQQRQGKPCLTSGGRAASSESKALFGQGLVVVSRRQRTEVTHDGALFVPDPRHRRKTDRVFYPRESRRPRAKKILLDTLILMN
jgi:hypothetical protein